MILVNLLGFICLRIDQKSIKSFLISKLLLNANFERKIITMQTDWGGEYEKLNGFD